MCQQCLSYIYRQFEVATLAISKTSRAVFGRAMKDRCVPWEAYEGSGTYRFCLFSV